MTPPPQEAAARACLPETRNTKASGILKAAAQLLASLERGAALDARILREAMTTAFEASDTDGAWLWKDAYEASEAAAVLFLRKYGTGMLRKADGPARYLAMLERLSALLPSHTRRSEESDEFQQFSTPLGLGFLMIHAAQLSPGTLVLEPSAGTGLLAIHAEVAGAALALNELAEARHAMLSGLFPKIAGDAFQRRADRRLSRGGNHARDRRDEPALLGFAQYRPHDARRDRPAYPLGASPPAAGRPPRGTYA